MPAQAKTVTARPSREPRSALQPAGKVAGTTSGTAKRAPARPAASASLLALFLFGAITQSARAQQPPEPAEGQSQWGLGIAAGVDRRPYRGIENKTRALPLVAFENKWFSVAGLGADLKLPSAGPVSFRLRARYMDDGYEASDSPFLAGMAERKGGVWLGGAALWRNDIANLSAELLGDASGDSKGTRFKLMVDRRFQAGAFDVTPRLAAIRLDDKYVSYYYGVNASEVTANRRFYQGGSAVNLEVGLRVGYAIAPKQSVFVDVSTTSLGSSIKDSPLVDRSTQTGVRVGYLYRF